MARQSRPGRRARQAGTALAFGVLLGVAACGSAARAPATFVPKGSEAPASPQASGAPAGVPPLARFAFPSSVHFHFAPLPSDPRQAAAVRTDENFELAYYYAVYSDGKDMKVLSYVSGREPSVRAAEVAGVDQNRSTSFTGTARFYNTRVVPVPGVPSNLTVQTCVNDSRMFLTNRHTGKIMPGQSTAPDKTVFLLRDTLAPDGAHWKIVATDPTFYPHGAAKECYP